MTQDDGNVPQEPEAFGAWLGRQLRRKNMSQSDLATELDVTRAAVSAWITGRAAPRIEKIQAIEEILGLAAGSSVTRDEAPDSTGSISWHHRPAHADGGRELGNAAAFAFDPDLTVLAREATQNSIDERLDGNRPVRVRFTLHELTGERLRRLQEALRWDDLVPHFEAAADPRQKVGRVLANGLQELRERGSLLLLRIDDYNAHGLTGPEYDTGRFAAVVRRLLDSHKTGTAGGSYGLGKATIWATSQFGLVIMNSTLSETYEGRRECRMVGRLDLPWREVNGVQYAGPAWLGESDPLRHGAARSWWAGDRTVEEFYLTRGSSDPGTSFLIVGAYDPSGEAVDLEQMHGALVRALATGFWASMVVGRDSAPLLEASVEAFRDGQVVMAEERVDPHRYEPARSRAVRAFLDGTTVSQITAAEDVIALPVPLTVPPRKDDTNTETVEHQAVLLVTPTTDDDERPNRLVCTRGTRMVVLERTVSDVPLGAIRFQAVLLAGRASRRNGAEADLAEAFLRAAEPPEHNDWKQTEDLTSTYARGAATRLKEFRKAMVDRVREAVRPMENITDIETPASLRELLKLDPPPAPRSPGYPTIRSATGAVDADGAWCLRVEIKLPERDDPWLVRPLLRFATRSGPRPEARWAHLTAESHCEVTEDGDLRCAAGARTAVFTGISDVASHPVTARMAVAEVDLARGKESAQ
ncbi:helix-turn-helix domain-containing protein [Sphaerimonospora mesophila]|uniref:helix-turn-helix domain-containing protein n=1 Tax=Sphaerimonospora mesophila TaxID=37483 RepID=UPI0006E306E3